MTNLKQFVEGKEFGSEGLPKGDTYFSDTADVTEVETEFEGKKKIRYQIKEAGKTYYVGTKVMDGIKEALKEGAKRVRVTRTGEGIKTNYSVVGIKD